MKIEEKYLPNMDEIIKNLQRTLFDIKLEDKRFRELYNRHSDDDEDPVVYDPNFLDDFPLLEEVQIEDSFITKLPSKNGNCWTFYLKMPPYGRIGKHLSPSTYKKMIVLGGTLYDDANGNMYQRGEVANIDMDKPHSMRAGQEQVDIVSVMFRKYAKK